MAQLRSRFLDGTLANGIEASIAEEAFRQLQGFATYGFCKSHAAAFALIAYQTLWLKAYYPVEFYCALLNHQPMGFYAPDVVVGDIKRHGIQVLRPDINLSQGACTVAGIEPPQIRLGLRYLYGLGEAGQERLLAARGRRPFADLADFCRRTRLPKPLVEDLIRSGAMESLGQERRPLLWALGGLRYLEEALIDEPEEPVALPPLDDWEALSWDYELLGMTPGDHVLRLLRPRLAGQGILPAARLADLEPGRVVTVAGRVAVRQRPPTAKGHVFVTLEDETGLANLIIRPDLYERSRDALDTPLLIATGIVQRQGAAISLLAQHLRPLQPLSGRVTG